MFSSVLSEMQTGNTDKCKKSSGINSKRARRKDAETYRRRADKRIAIGSNPYRDGLSVFYLTKRSEMTFAQCENV